MTVVMVMIENDHQITLHAWRLSFQGPDTDQPVTKRIAEEGSIAGARHSLQESVAYFKSSAIDPLAFYVLLEDKKEISRFGASIYQRFFDPRVEVRLDPDFQSIRAWTQDSWFSTYWLEAAFTTPVMMLFLPSLANFLGIGPEQSHDALENLRQSLPGTIPAFSFPYSSGKLPKPKSQAPLLVNSLNGSSFLKIHQNSAS